MASVVPVHVTEAPVVEPDAETSARGPKNLVIIPAYNEEEALPGTIAQLQCLSDEFELLVIDDGSHDRTAQLARALACGSRLALQVINLPLNCGIGAAVQSGYAFAARKQGYRYVIQFDGDGQHDAAFIPALVAECEARNLDLCVGSRFLNLGKQSFRSSFLRRLGIRFFAGMIGMLSGARVSDPTSGFRCAGPRAWASFAHSYPDDYPEPEALFWCVRNKLRVGETPVRMRRRQGGVSSIRYGRTLYYMLKVSLAILIDRLRSRGILEMKAETLMLMGGVAAFVLTVYWVRSRDLREKYAVPWLIVATLLLLCGLFPEGIMTFAEASRLSYPSAVLFIALTGVYVFSLSVSVSLTHQYRRNVRLAQEIALLEHRVRQLEQAAGARSGDVRP